VQQKPSEPESDHAVSHPLRRRPVRVSPFRQRFPRRPPASAAEQTGVSRIIEGMLQGGIRVLLDRIRTGEPVHGEAKAAPSWGIVSPGAGPERPKPGCNEAQVAEIGPVSPSHAPRSATAALQTGCSDFP
jgi:hypothetical protein